MLSFQALSRMREYERLRTEGKLSELVASQSAARDKLIKDDVTTSSAGDVGSESSISDVQVSHAFWRTTAHALGNTWYCTLLEVRVTFSWYWEV